MTDSHIISVAMVRCFLYPGRSEANMRRGAPKASSTADNTKAMNTRVHVRFIESHVAQLVTNLAWGNLDSHVALQHAKVRA